MADVFNFTNGNEDISKIEENLWLGNSFAAGDIKDLKAKGITAILSVVNGSSKHYFYKEHGFYHKVKIYWIMILKILFNILGNV